MEKVMNSKEFWQRYKIPVQDEFLDIEEINPADAYRIQAEVINLSGPLYAELEVLEARLNRVESVKKSLRNKILAANMPVPSSSTRTNDLVDAFILSNAKSYTSSNGNVKDISDYLLRLDKRELRLKHEVRKLDRRIRALEAMAEKCDRIMNWAKHEARLESR